MTHGLKLHFLVLGTRTKNGKGMEYRWSVIRRATWYPTHEHCRIKGTMNKSFVRICFGDSVVHHSLSVAQKAIQKRAKEDYDGYAIKVEEYSSEVFPHKMAAE
jgi:hypothetical protein